MSYVALTGGVGGAKLALGLTHLLPADELTFIVNTGDDFRHLGLHVSPDLDTLMYTLSGLSNEETGWGRRGESWNCLESYGALGGETWFNLGDRDLAVHLRRSELLQQGVPLHEVTRRLNSAVGVDVRILPMTDDAVATRVLCATGELAFQHYFVRERCEPVVSGIRFDGAETAQCAPGVMEALQDPTLAGVLICPSNPYLSVDPILAVPGLRQALVDCAAPVIAVSPVVGGEAIKGPTTKIMAELGLPLTALTVAEHYADFLDGFIIDLCDEGLLEQSLSMPMVAAQSVMRTLDDKVQLAQTALAFFERL